MKRVKSGTKAPEIRLVGWNLPVRAVTAAAAMAGLATAGAHAAPGDLDPSFGDVGRQANLEIISNFGFESLWSVDVADDDSVLFGGGEAGCPFGCYEDYFVGKLTPTGTPVAGFLQSLLPLGAVYDTALQADGKLLGVGTQGVSSGLPTMVLFRLRVDGSLDPEFGSGGVVHVSDSKASGYAVSAEANGRVTVAGYRDSARGNTLLVARFLPNGTRDPAFGTNGQYEAADSAAFAGLPVRLAVLPSGGYRILANWGEFPGECTVAALNETGSPDPTFGGGTGATRVRTTAGDSVLCNSMTVLADGRFVVVGSTAAGKARAIRLLASGENDTSFNADAALGTFRRATAIAPGAAGKLFVTTEGEEPGVHVLRLSADGALDASYGTAGKTSINLFASRAPIPRVTDLKALSGDRLLVAGQTNGPAFIARLLGSASGGGPGVLSMKSSRVVATEEQGQAVLAVSRTGGSRGAVSVSYATEAAPGAVVNATPGQDLTATSGRLEWADGDAGERQIVVPLANNSDTEVPEFFAVSLSAPDGGAGLGTTGADVEIAGGGYPAGQIKLQTLQALAAEGLPARFGVSRNFYSQGTVSVTLRVAAESTATAGEDFASSGQAGGWQDVVLSWVDGDRTDRIVSVSILKDGRSEADETLVLELVAPTGGAVIAAESKATVTLVQSFSAGGGGGGGSGNGGGGGGAFGSLAALMFGLIGFIRRRMLRVQHLA